MIRRLAALLLFVLASSAFAEESYLGLYMQGQKVGYVSSNTIDDSSGGEKLKRTDSRTVISAELLGQSLSMSIDSQSWNDAKGAPRLMKFSVDSSGRSQRTEATFAKDGVHVVIDNNGQITHKLLAIPKDARIVDDAMMSLLADGAPTGSERTYYVLDPMTSTLVKNTAKLVGPKKVKVKDQEFDSTLIEIIDPRAPMKVYISGKGDLIKAEAFAGIEMYPITKAEAFAAAGPGKPIDIASATRILTDKPLGDLDSLKSTTLKFTDVSLSRAPSDDHQTIKGEGETWTVELHPVQPNLAQKTTISQAAKQKPAYLESGLNIPAKSDQFRALAKKVIGPSTGVVESAGKIQKYVHGLMSPNAGIGVLRDATEVLKTKEGVCRDYAILTATILRAARIPARLASGLVFFQGAFYYHAWTEYWDGEHWVGLDSTRPSGKVTAGHFKLAHGSVEEAFLFTFLDKAHVEVLNVKRKASGGGTHEARP